MSHQDRNKRPKRPNAQGENDEMAEPARARPKPTPETQHFWDGTQGRRTAPAALRRLRQRLFPAAPVLPDLRLAQGQRVQGQRQGHAVQLRHQPPPAAPGFTPPYAIAVVELDEGPRMMSNIVDCPQTPEALELDMTLEVAFEKLDDNITLPLFRPAKG